MTRLQEIEKRMAEIPVELEQEESNLEQLEKEVEDLKEERKAILEKIEKRKALINDVASMQNVEVIKDFKEERNMNTEVKGIDSVEYRNAFLKRLQGVELNEVEKRSIASANVAGAIPTMTSEMIMTKMREIAPMLSEVTLLNVAGNVNFAIEGTNNDAALHTENGLINASSDTLVTVSLGGYEITKLVRISQTVRTMSINSFEGWLTDLIAENIATKIENYLVNGTGTGQPKGVDYAQAWVDTTNAVAFAGANPTYAEMTELVSYLKGGYYRKAKWLMNHKTFWAQVQAIRDDAKAPIVSEMGGKYYILGKEVLFSDYVNDGDIFLGDFKKVVANLSQDINVKASEHSGFQYNAIDYLGSAIFDSDIAIPEAIVKGAAVL